MDGVITEKNYPIQNIWLFKQASVIIIILPAYLIFMLINVGYGVAISLGQSVALFLWFVFMLVMMIATQALAYAVQRAHFHWSLEDKFMVLHQGVISKANRNVPYGVIQGVFVNQGLFDRIFSLASLTLEDFSQGGQSSMDVGGYVGSGKSRHEILGFVGNKIHIPGLRKSDAEALKAIILQKMKENPIEDNQSGL